MLWWLRCRERREEPRTRTPPSTIMPIHGVIFSLPITIVSNTIPSLAHHNHCDYLHHHHHHCVLIRLLITIITILVTFPVLGQNIKHPQLKGEVY